MRILIVNGYSSTSEENSKLFKRYEQLIHELFRNQNDFTDTDVEFIIRQSQDLDDFIYEVNSIHVKKSSANAFDNVDLVFVEGDVNLLPWSSQAQKILILLRMCIRTQTFLFASGFGMQALVYLAATNVEKTIQIVNGHGMGGKVKDFNKFDSSKIQLKSNQYYLDNETGDLFHFNYDTSEWIPKMNTGLHYSKATKDYDSYAKHVANKPIYKAKVVDNDLASYLSTTKEDYCYTKNAYLRHLAMVSLPSQFIIPTRNLWEMHKFNFVNNSKSFVVIAETKKCPQIISFGNYCVATLFTISKKYLPTVEIMRNFIRAKLKEIKEMKQRKLGVEKLSDAFRNSSNEVFEFENKPKIEFKADTTTKSLRSAQILKSIANVDSLLSSKSRPSTAKMAHSGFALAHNKSGNFIVENNCIRNDLKIRVSNDDIYQSLQDTDLQENIDNTRTFSNTGTFFNKSRNITSAIKRAASTSHKTIGLSTNSVKNQYNKGNPIDGFSGVNQTNLENNFYDRTNSNLIRNIGSPNFDKNRAELALLIYPDLPRNAVKEEQFWIPGQLSKSRPMTANSRSSNRTIIIPATNKFGSKSKKFIDTTTLDAGRMIPCIRTSGEYVNEQDKILREEKEQKKKNLGPAFIKAGTKADTHYISNYVSISYSEPPGNHKFREVKKDKWVGGTMNVY